MFPLTTEIGGGNSNNDLGEDDEGSGLEFNF